MRCSARYMVCMMWTLLLSTLAWGTPEVVQVEAGPGHSCALYADGGVSCWGGLSAEALTSGGEPFSTRPTAVRELQGVQQIAVGGQNLSCAVRGGGELWCWFAGQAPGRVEGLRARQVSIGQGHLCAVDLGGQVWCWGYNGRGQIGDGTTENRAEPVKVEGLTKVRQVAAGMYHSCALHEDRTVSCWGYNFRGQIGDGTSGAMVLRPSQALHLRDIQSISAGSFHTCALTLSGQATCWGSNGSGQLGDSTRDHSTALVGVRDLSDAIKLDVGADHTCAIRRSGEAVCWGNNEDGQLGTGDLRTRLRPTEVQGLGRAQQIAVGHHHTCALRQEGDIWCWGQNLAGQLGDGTRKRRSEPGGVE